MVWSSHNDHCLVSTISTISTMLLFVNEKNTVGLELELLGIVFFFLSIVFGITGIDNY